MKTRLMPLFAVIVVVALAVMLAPLSFAQDPQPVTIVTWERPTPDEPEWVHELREAEIAAFQAEYPWITVQDELTPVGTDYRQTYDRSLAAGTEPTVWNLVAFVDVQTRINNGTIGELTDCVTGWDLWEDGLVFSAFGDSLFGPEGSVYAIPSYAYQQGLIYNRRLAEEAGLDPDAPPATWDELVEWGVAMTDPSIPQFGFGLIGMAWNAWPFAQFTHLAGGQMIAPNGDGTWRITFTEDPGVDALMFWHSMIWEHRMVQQDVLRDFGPLLEDFQQERIAMFWGNIDFLVEAGRKYETPLENFGIAPMPVGPNGSAGNLAGGETWTISPNATPEQAAAACDYIKFMTYNQTTLENRWTVQNDNNALDGRPSMRLDLNKLDFATNWPAHWAPAFQQVTANTMAEPYADHYNEIKDLLAEPIQSILLNEGATRDDARAALEGVAQEAYSRFPETYQPGS